MNEYKIQHKVKTLAKLSFGKPEGTVIEINDFKIQQWGFDTGRGPYGDSWIVEKIMKAKTGIEAVNKFRKEFDKISPILCFTSQCYFSFHDQGFIIEKLNNNEEKLFMLRIIRDRAPVGLYFQEKDLDNYNKIAENFDSLAFEYLSASTNTVGYMPRLILLFSALEALAGKVSIDKSCPHCDKVTVKDISTYNKDVLKEILGNKLYGKMFGANGVRHKIAHGDNLNSSMKEDYLKIIYEKILSYLNTKYSTQLNLDIKLPQRHFFGNYEQINMFLVNNKNYQISIKNFNDDFKLDNEIYSIASSQYKLAEY